MQYSSHLLVKTYIIIFTATWGSCWQFFAALNDITISKSDKEPRLIHSEYFFGQCTTKKKIFYGHAHLDHMDVLGKIIVRGWVQLRRMPTCILLRGLSFEIDMLRSTAYAFQMCVPRITYCFSHRRFMLFYYEWYLPPDVAGGIDWDIYFFGPSHMNWG